MEIKYDILPRFVKRQVTRDMKSSHSNQSLFLGSAPEKRSANAKIPPKRIQSIADLNNYLEYASTITLSAHDIQTQILDAYNSLRKESHPNPLLQNTLKFLCAEINETNAEALKKHIASLLVSADFDFSIKPPRHLIACLKISLAGFALSQANQFVAFRENIAKYNDEFTILLKEHAKLGNLYANLSGYNLKGFDFSSSEASSFCFNFKDTNLDSAQFGNIDYSNCILELNQQNKKSKLSSNTTTTSANGTQPTSPATQGP